MARLVVLALLAGCGDPSLRGDDGSIDAGLDPIDAADASTMDAGSFDAGSMDAGPFDAGSMDAGSFDAGLVGIACDVGGVPGTCELVSTCTGDRMATPGHCPGPVDIQCCTSRTDAGGACDPAVYVYPNEGLVEEAGDPGCPYGMARVESFCVDRFEASLVLADDAGPIGSWSPYHNPGTRRIRALSLRGAVPQGYVSGTQAARACSEAGKRLCSDIEWLRACRGPSGFTYPYGNVREVERCNETRAQHPAVERFGTSADWIWSRLGDACISQIPDSLARTAEHAGCESAEGPFDMMGNLHEWTADPAGTFPGGFYYDTYRNGEGCLYRTTAHDMGHWDYSTGFRCCADAL